MATWTNWARTESCEPLAIARPESLEELCETVAEASRAGHGVRVSASGHSFTDCATTDGVMVRLDHLTRELSFDPESGYFTVEGGVTLHALNRMLDAHGVAFENLGDIDRQTVTGSVSTGTHGTGERFANVSTQVVGMKLVRADGSVLEIDETEPDLLRAARVAVGTLGVIYSVTVRTVPAYTINRVDRPRPLAETLERLDELNAENDHFEFYVFPHTDVALCRESRRTSEEPRPRNRALVYAQEVMLENWAASVMARALRRFPSKAPALARLASRGTGRGTKVDASFKVFASERRVRFTEMEYAVPRENGRELVERVLAVANRADLGVGYPIEVRFVAADDSYLSPAYGRDTCYVAVHQDPRLDWRRYFAKVESIARSYGGRPHWGKRHFRSAADLAPEYPEWEAFAKTRRHLDPEDTFTNAYTERVLGG